MCFKMRVNFGYYINKKILENWKAYKNVSGDIPTIDLSNSGNVINLQIKPRYLFHSVCKGRCILSGYKQHECVSWEYYNLGKALSDYGIYFLKTLMYKYQIIQMLVSSAYRCRVKLVKKFWSQWRHWDVDTVLKLVSNFRSPWFLFSFIFLNCLFSSFLVSFKYGISLQFIFLFCPSFLHFLNLLFSPVFSSGNGICLFAQSFNKYLSSDH